MASPAPSLDLDRITAGVLHGLREQSQVVPIRRRWVPMALAAAASVALAVTVWWPSPGEAPETPIAAGAEYVPTLFPELDELLESELEVVLASVEPTAEVVPLGDVPRLGDLTDSELEQLLDAVEG